LKVWENSLLAADRERKLAIGSNGVIVHYNTDTTKAKDGPGRCSDDAIQMEVVAPPDGGSTHRDCGTGARM
jgi:hypothetical protein